MNQPQFIDLANAPEKSDEALYKEFSETRDKAIMGKIFRNHMTLVFGVCMKYMGEKSAAQDATMEIFERLLVQEIESEIKNFKGYLYVMTRNYCLMKKRGEKVVFAEITDRDVELATEMHPIDMAEPTKESALEKCIEELKDLQKKCVQQFYLKQQSYMQISTGLKITLNAVKSNIQNGKRNLKNCIETQI